MVKYILMPEETIQKIKKGDKFFVDGEFNPNSARMLWKWRNLPAGLRPFDTAKKIGCIFLDGHSEKKLPFFVKMWN